MISTPQMSWSMETIELWSSTLGLVSLLGEDLITAGTHGWIDEEFVTSAREHDETALIKVDSWLRSQVPSQTG